MTSPEAPQDGIIAAHREKPPAAHLNLVTLSKRSDFLRATRATHRATSGFVLQMRTRAPAELPDETNTIRVGYTCSKKVGNAVARNRAKRRLREIARLILPTHGRPGTDYVLIGRRDSTASLPFTRLQADLIKVLAKLHNPKP